MKIKNFELELYLDSWLDNVGFSSRDIEYTLMNAMRHTESIKHWFGAPDA